MSTLDQFEVEPSSYYSGSYTGQVIFGDLLAQGFGPTANERRIATSKLSGRSFSYWQNTYTPYWLVDGYVSGSFAGRPQRFSRQFSTSETYFDSIVPNPLDIHLRNTSGLALYAGELICVNGIRWGINPATSPTDVAGEGTIMPIWATDSFDAVATFMDTSVVDQIWYLHFPFQSRYKGVQRLLDFNGIFEKTYDLSVDFNGATVTPVTKSNRLGTFALGVENTTHGGFGWLQDGRAKYPDVDLDIIGTPPPRLLFEMYYGTGDGKETNLNGNYRKGPGYRGFNILVEFAYKPLLRGFRYGLMNTTQINTSCVFRHGRFGQVRDMLEQRKVGKFLDSSKGTTTTLSPVSVIFVSGTTTYSRSIDYVTATNPDYNTRDSGVYDYEYRSGQPFFE